jgi:hypothetical protein
MPLKCVLLLKLKGKMRKMGHVFKKRDIWHPDYIFSGQWYQWLKKGTNPLKTGHLVTLC